MTSLLDSNSIYFLQTNILCALFLGVIYFTMKSRGNMLYARRRAFNKLVFTIFAICISDIFAWLFAGKDFAGAGTLVFISNTIYYLAMTMAGYVWLCYVDLRIRPDSPGFKRRCLLRSIPLGIMAVLLALNPLTKMLFTVNSENVYSRGDYVFLHWILSWFYLIYATVETVIAIKKEKSRTKKEQLRPLLWFIIPPAATALIQISWYGIVSTQCGMVLAILIIVLNYMLDEISKDTLTGLNNRGTLENAAVEQIQSSGTEFTVFMCDVDKFKAINDTLGHNAGDIVLKRMARALKSVCYEEKKNLFLCRYGGDEFVIYGTDLKEGEADELVLKLEENVKKVNSDENGMLVFGISVGYATGVCTSFEDVEALIGKADESMYEAKQAKKRKK